MFACRNWQTGSAQTRLTAGSNPAANTICRRGEIGIHIRLKIDTTMGSTPIADTNKDVCSEYLFC